MSVSLVPQDMVLKDSAACRITASICANALPDRRLTRVQQTAALQGCVVLGLLRCKHQQARRGCTSDGIGFKEWRLARVIRQVLDHESQMQPTCTIPTAAGPIPLFQSPPADGKILVDDTTVGAHRWLEADSLAAVQCICCGVTARVQQLCSHCMATQVSLLNHFSMEAPEYSNKSFWEGRHSGDVEEWYCGYPPLRAALLQAATAACKKRILVAGCGSSSLCLDIHHDASLSGFSVLGTDISHVAITRLSSEASRVAGDCLDGRELDFVVDNSTCSQMLTGSFGLIVDKGTLDAIATGGQEGSRAAVSEYTRLTTWNGAVLLVTGGSVESRFGLFSEASEAWTVELCKEKTGAHFRVIILRKCPRFVSQLHLGRAQEAAAVSRAAQIVRVDGVCALGAALDESELALCRRICCAVLQRALAPNGTGDFTMRSRGACRWDVLLGSAGDAIREKIARHQCWWPVVRSVLGDAAELLFVGVVASYPGAGVQKWHADGAHLFGIGHQLPAHCLNVFVPLQDMTNRALGGTEFCCGSHEIKNVVESWTQLQTQGVTQDVNDRDYHITTNYGGRVASYTPAPPAGHAIVFDYRLLHRGLANETADSTRMLLYFTFVKPWYNDVRNFK